MTVQADKAKVVRFHPLGIISNAPQGYLIESAVNIRSLARYTVTRRHSLSSSFVSTRVCISGDSEHCDIVVNVKRSKKYQSPSLLIQIHLLYCTVLMQ